MEQSINLVLKSLAISGLMVGYYWLVLRGRKMHAFNRFYLLMTVLVAMVVPFLRFDYWVPGKTAAAPALKLLQFVATDGEEQMPLVKEATHALTVGEWLSIGYGAVSLTLLLWLAYSVSSIYRVRRAGHIERRSGYNLVVTEDGRAPFSFFRNIFWKEGLDEHSEGGSLILRHELVHMRQWHTLDKLAMQLTIALCWFNPFLWLVNRELAMIHEFLADEEAIQDNDTSAFATMLLEPYYKSALPVMINPFYSSIKQRIMMLSKTNKTSYRNLRRAMIVPLMLVPVLLFSFRVHTVPTTVANKHITLVLDAGHGGNDNGATAPDGTLEKDMNLRVCKRIAALAREYNVTVIQTRPDDKYINLVDRAAIADKQPNAVMVSIHVNKNSPAAKTADGMTVKENVARDGVEFFISTHHKNPAECQLLASAIGSRMMADGIKTNVRQKGLIVTGRTQRPAVLIELGNMDNALDLALINSDEGVDKLSRDILTGVAAYANAH
jgi:N-acetylmuramoyl-L-alanine amidase